MEGHQAAAVGAWLLVFECDNVLAPVCIVITLLCLVLAAKTYNHAHAAAALKGQEAGARIPGRLWIIAVCRTTVHGSLLQACILVAILLLQMRCWAAASQLVHACCCHQQWPRLRCQSCLCELWQGQHVPLLQGQVTGSLPEGKPLSKPEKLCTARSFSAAGARCWQPS